MKIFLYNTKYFIKEVRDILLNNIGTNVLSLISTGLIFFVLTLVIGGWMITSDVAKSMMGEAEVSVYLPTDISETNKSETIKKILSVNGVNGVDEIAADEAFARMEKVLGEDAKVLSYFDDNPFDAFLEVSINLEQTENVLTSIKTISNVELVRDNREVLDKMSQISNLLNVLSFIFLVAVGLTTIVIVSHIIRQGIYYHKEQINTLNLLGAPKSFIVTPFYIEGILLTLVGCGFALTLGGYVFTQIFDQLRGPLPFIPMPSYDLIMSRLVFIMLSLSFLLGIIGCMMGIQSSKEKAQ